MIGPSSVRCAGCGAAPLPGDPYEWVCPNRQPGDDIEHVMVRHLDLAGLPFVTSDHDNPFVRYRSLLHAYHRWIRAGRDDASFVALVDDLDAAVLAVDGRGFRRTPLTHHPALDSAVGARVWVKDETGNVSGSHKGRHLFGLMVLLKALAGLGRLSPEQQRARLAIASCGNAALAAAVVAAAAKRELDVYVPVDADAGVIDRLGSLGATVTICERGPDSIGDPAYHRFSAAVRVGAIPFGCQGPDNGLTIEGGATLAWEIAEALAEACVAPSRLVVQVGGGALASACIEGMREAVALGVLPKLPVIDAVQTRGAYPLARAFGALTERIDEGLSASAALDHAARHRSRYMRAWESVPASVASGILDDETYDWLAVVAGLMETGGSVTVVDEATLIEANELGRQSTGIDVDHTGTSGLAGLLHPARSGLDPLDSDVVIIFSGARR